MRFILSLFFIFSSGVEACMVQDIMSSVTTTFTLKNEESHVSTLTKSSAVKARGAHPSHHHGGSHDSCVQCLNYQVVPVFIAPVSFDLPPVVQANTQYQFSHLSPFYETLRRPPKA